MADSSTGRLHIRDSLTGDVAVVDMSGDRMVVGRSPDVELQLDNAAVSRQHAELFADAYKRWWIKDLGSRNGTIVNGTIVDEAMLMPGDRIQIETFILDYEATGPQPQRPRRPPTAAGLGTGTGELTLAVSDDVDPANVSRLDAMTAPKIDSGHLSRLTEFVGELLATDTHDDRLIKLCDLLVARAFHGNSAVAVRVEHDASPDDEPVLLCEPRSGRNWRAGEQPYISRTMLREVMRVKVPIVATNAGGGSSLEISLAGSVMEMAAVCCPIGQTEQAVDLLYVTFPVEYGTGEWLALAALAAEQFQLSENVWQARRIEQEQAIVNKELARAERIQNGLIPDPDKLDIDSLEVAVGFEPCQSVGGDYVDVVPCPDGRIFITVCDVCGKGLQAALITASLHTMVHMTSTACLSVPELMKRFNDYLCDMLPDESFVTAIGVLLDPKTGKFQTVNAGHPPAMIAQPDSSLRYLKSAEHPPLGYLPFDFEAESATLAPGDVLHLFTDGLTELENESKAMLGIDGTADCFARSHRECKGGSLTDIADCLTRELDKFQGQAVRPDDRTFMLVRRRVS